MAPKHSPIPLILTKISVGLAAAPIFANFINPRYDTPQLHFVLHGAFGHDLMRCSHLQLKQWIPGGPIEIETVLGIAQDMLRSAGVAYLDHTPDAKDDPFFTTTISSPSILSQHDRLLAIQAAREAIIAAGVDPDISVICEAVS